MIPEVLLQWQAGADETLPLPSYETAGAAGADLRVNFPQDLRAEGFVLEPWARVQLPTGLRIALPLGYEAQIRPRSGLAAKHGITLVNAPGTIDADYRGPLGILLINLNDTAFHITHGMRVAQMVVAPVAQAGFVLARALEDTDRGEGGFGSTGVS